MQDSGPWIYDFRLSYFENFKNRRLQAAKTPGDIIAVRDEWDEVRTSDGIDLREFVKYAYSNKVQICLIDKVFREISTAIGKVLGDFGCGLGKAIFSIIDSITDLFGSFICTATLNSKESECWRSLLELFKNHRDENYLGDKEGRYLIRYYNVIGPRIVDSISSGSDSSKTYDYLWEKYISRFEGMIQREEKQELLLEYLKMIDEMANKYGLELSPKFNKIKDREYGKVL